MSEYTTANNTSLTLEKFNTEPVMTIYPDGRVTVSDKFKPDEAAAKVVEAFKTQWLADAQCAKIRELQSDVTQLENRLRALWDKLEGERKYYEDRIKRLEEAGDEMHRWCSNPRIVGGDTEAADEWREAKEAKP
jgi:hypothetical protein